MQSHSTEVLKRRISKAAITVRDYMLGIRVNSRSAKLTNTYNQHVNNKLQTMFNGKEVFVYKCC